MGKIMKNGVPYASGSEIPKGGTKGQVLAKASDIDGDMEWKDEEGGGGATPTLDAVLQKGNTTERDARFTDELNGRQVEVGASGTYMTGNGTEGMRQFSVNQNGISAVDNLVGTITPKFVVPFEPSGEDQVAMSDAVKESFKKALDVSGVGAVIFNATDNILATELNAAYANGPIYLKYNGNYYPVVSVTEEGSNYYIGTTSGSGRNMTFYYDYYGTDLEFSKVETYELYGDLDVPVGSTTATIKRNLSHVRLVGSGDTVQYKVKGGNYAEQTFELATTKYVQDNAGGMHFEVGVEKRIGTYTEAGVTYQVYSNIIKIDALPATAGITQYPHGIQNIQQILQVYGFTTDGFVLNAPRQNAQDNIAIYQVGKNNSTGSIGIEVGKDRSSKQAYVCLVYAKKN